MNSFGVIKLYVFFFGLYTSALKGAVIVSPIPKTVVVTPSQTFLPVSTTKLPADFTTSSGGAILTVKSENS